MCTAVLYLVQRQGFPQAKIAHDFHANSSNRVLVGQAVERKHVQIPAIDAPKHLCARLRWHHHVWRLLPDMTHHVKVLFHTLCGVGVGWVMNSFRTTRYLRFTFHTHAFKCPTEISLPSAYLDVEPRLTQAPASKWQDPKYGE